MNIYFSHMNIIPDETKKSTVQKIFLVNLSQEIKSALVYYYPESRIKRTF
jgi:hypothetical protein